MPLGIGIGADAYAVKKNNRDGKRNGPRGGVIPGQKRFNDPWVAQLRKTIPQANGLPHRDKNTLKALGNEYCRIAPVDQAGTGHGIVDAMKRANAVHHAEMKLLLDYANAFAGALLKKTKQAGAVPRRPLVRVASGGQIVVDPAVMAAARAGATAHGGITPAMESLEALAQRYGMAQFYHKAVVSFCEVLDPTDGRLTRLGQRMGAWKAEADRARQESPIDPKKVEALSATADDLFDEGRELLRSTPSRVLSYNADEPRTKVWAHADGTPAVEDLEASGYVEKVPHLEGEVVRLAMEQACNAHRSKLSESMLAIQGRTQDLREWAGLTNSHYIVHGAQVEQRMEGPSVVPLLGQRLGDFQQCEGDDNRGRYRRQSPIIFAQRLISHVLHDMAQKRPEDAKAIVERAQAMRRSSDVGERLHAELTMADILHDPAKVIMALGLDSNELLHRPNKQPRYDIKAELYTPLHEMLSWRGLEILEILARGTHDQKDLGWAFSLSDEGQLDAQLTKIPRAWDTTRMLAGQVRGVSSSQQFWSKFWGDPPLKGEGRIVAGAAQVATLQLLLEQVWLSFPPKQRPRVPKGVGIGKRAWAKDPGVALTSVLGLPEPPHGTLAKAVDSGSEQDCHPDALQVLKQGRRYHARLGELLADLRFADQPFPWLEPFVPDFAKGDLKVVFSERTGRIVLEGQSGATPN